jgi:hypothetical protein
MIASATAGDWPQYMRVAEHTGDAADETLAPPLELRAQVPLDDALLASPAVAGRRVYVVDQMGRAYCIDAKMSAVLWQSHPDGLDAKGGNTSSPLRGERPRLFRDDRGEGPRPRRGDRPHRRKHRRRLARHRRAHVRQ